MPAPAATISLLHRADGSATYTAGGYTVIGAVNGPVEVQRRDELPDEAAIEISVRPASGVGTTRERHIESILQSTLRHIILTREFPRSLLQLTLQIAAVPERPDLLSSASYLPLLPPLLTTSVLTLLSANLPLSTTLTATLVAVIPPSQTPGPKHRILLSPTPQDISTASSLHVFGFTGAGKLLVAESEGDFDLGVWNGAYEAAEGACLSEKEDGDPEMVVDDRADEAGAVKQDAWLRSVVREKIERDQRWRSVGQG